MHGVSLLRHLIRAEISRREVFEQGRIPEFSGPPSESLQLRLKAAIALRHNQSADAAALIEQAGNLETPLRGTVDGNPFEGFSDLDDLLGPVLEVFTATGAYYWIDCAQVQHIEFDPVTHLSDTLWRSASIQTTGGIDGRIHIPAIYYGSEKSADSRVTLGRTTEWIASNDNAVTRGAGQREFLLGDDVLPILNIRNLTFSQDNA
jgi:type VI secretion system protein ImpE